MEKAKKPKKEIILNDRFHLIKSLGKGQFSEVFQAIDLQSKEEVALKYQPKSSFQTTKTNLHKEHLILDNLKNISGVPSKKLFLEHKSHDLLVLPIYKETLKDLYDRLGHFSLKTVLVLAIELIDILEKIHEQNIIHLDLKPENIMIGSLEKSGKQLCIIDYGLAKIYYDPKSKMHIPFGQTNLFTGSYTYASLNSHLGYELSRRDDFESLGYVLIYFLKGSLPWQFMTHENGGERIEKGKQLKKEISIETLCKGVPDKFKEYFKYVRQLKFDEKPDYQYLRGLFLEMKKVHGIDEVEEGDMHEWIEKENRPLNSADFVEEDEEFKDIHRRPSQFFLYDETRFNNQRTLSRSPLKPRSITEHKFSPKLRHPKHEGI